MEIEKAKGEYSLEDMERDASIASTANGLEISGNSFKVTSLTACPDMLLYACEQIKVLKERLEIEQEQFKEIRLYTKDGALASLCAGHEMKIKNLLKNSKL